MKVNILICCSGSIATIKIPEIILNLLNYYNIYIILTSTSEIFFLKSINYNNLIYKQLKEQINLNNIIFNDKYEWLTWNKIGDPILHIELRRWADILIVIPASANTIAKMVNGICDNLLLCTIRAWDKSRPIIVCPAMNSLMLEHYSFQKHLDILKENNIIIIEPEVKNLACGEKGNGALASVQKIIEVCHEQANLYKLQWENDLLRRKEKENAYKNIQLIQQTYQQIQKDKEIEEEKEEKEEKDKKEKIEKEEKRWSNQLSNYSYFQVFSSGILMGIFVTFSFLSIKFKLYK